MDLISRGSRMYSILHFKCPRCQEGDLYPTATFSFRKPFDMYKACPVCGQSYEPEPGFYYGAMFISYIITGWFSLAVVAFFRWGLHWSLLHSFLMLFVIGGLLFVYFYRLSRAIWLTMNVRYEPDWKQQEKSAAS